MLPLAFGSGRQSCMRPGGLSISATHVACVGGSCSTAYCCYRVVSPTISNLRSFDCLVEPNKCSVGAETSQEEDMQWMVVLQGSHRMDSQGKLDLERRAGPTSLQMFIIEASFRVSESARVKLAPPTSFACSSCLHGRDEQLSRNLLPLQMEL